MTISINRYLTSKDRRGEMKENWREKRKKKKKLNKNLKG